MPTTSPSPDLSHPAWASALSLAERRAHKATTHPVGSDSELADLRVEQVRRIPAFREAEGMADLHRYLDLGAEDLHQLLGQQTSSIATNGDLQPAWLRLVAQVADNGALPPGIVIPPFLRPFAPWISATCQALQESMPKPPGSEENPAWDPQRVLPILFANLPNQLAELSSRVLILEINVARLDGRLQGDSPEARQASFFRQMSDPLAALELLREYPVLARHILQCLDQWRRTRLELLAHLVADWEAIREHFDWRNPGTLQQISEDGDRHRDGRAVAILHFSCGRRLVYKPRSLAVELHFRDLLSWVNQRANHPPFRLESVLDRGDHGWVAFAEQADCSSSAEVRRFYARQGAFLALFYALHATDFHYGNIIASGEHPVMVDLEALFHTEPAQEEEDSAADLAGRLIQRSVLRIGLLPQRLWAREDYEGIDLSGLAATPGQLSPQMALRYEDVRSDEVRVVYEQARFVGGRNRARLQGEAVDPANYRQDFARGFEEVYRALIRHRDALLAPEGPLETFRDDETRIILRPTRFYGLLLREGTHPDCLRDGLDRDILCAQLWADISRRPYLQPLVPSELDDLWRGDVPIFFSQPGSRHLEDSRGRRTEQFFAQSGLEAARAQIQAMSEADLERQSWLIRSSFSLLQPAGHRQDSPRRWDRLQPAPAATPSELQTAALEIGERLSQRAVRGEDGAVSWVGIAAAKSHQWHISPLSVDLYSGVPGVALFLAQLGKSCDEQRFTELAHRALITTRDQIERIRDMAGPVGGYYGWGALVYCFTRLGQLSGDQELLSEAETLAKVLDGDLAEDRKLDLIGGSAGAIAALLALHSARPAGPALEIAMRCGEHLLEQAEERDEGLCWIGEDMLGQPLSGFGHGAAGIAWALARLAHASGDRRFLQASQRALAWERSLFVPELHNWLDLRRFEQAAPQQKADHKESSSQGNDSATAPRVMHAWCHGAPGIGLSRLDLLAIDADPQLRWEVEQAVIATQNHGFGRNHSLCHGDFGNLELLLRAGRELPSPELALQAEGLASALLSRGTEHGWLCGVPMEVETPGLMTGTAGIGYQLLRLADMEQVPSVLTLAS